MTIKQMSKEFKKEAMKRHKANRELEQWLAENGAVETIAYDENTGQRIRRFTIDLTKSERG